MNTSEKIHLELANHYIACLKQHGDTSNGMDWPDGNQNLKRFNVMTELFMKNISELNRPIRLLDFACGTSHYYDYLQNLGLNKYIKYTGIDINPEAISIAQEKYPSNSYLCLDILDGTHDIGEFDYVVINGLFTQKIGISDLQMKKFLVSILSEIFPKIIKGIAFNAMSNNVDYKKSGAFHLDLSWISNVITTKFSRNFVIRHDYGLYENTIYILNDKESYL